MCTKMHKLPEWLPKHKKKTLRLYTHRRSVISFFAKDYSLSAKYTGKNL